MWTIVMQEEKAGKACYPVQCKALRFFPMEKGGETIFAALKFPILQIIVVDPKGNALKLKMNAGRSIDHPEFTIQHPDKMERPTIVIGERKSRRVIPDMMASPVKVPGETERFASLNRFRERVEPFLGKELTDEILGLFAQRLVEIEQKRLKKSKRKQAA